MMQKLGLIEDMPIFLQTNMSYSCYASQFYKRVNDHMHTTELQLAPPCEDFTTHQPELSFHMRAILVSWLIEVHFFYALREQILFITINLIDRYCERKTVLKSEFQLLGVTCLLIASKYEYQKSPSIAQLISMTNNTYTKAQIVEQEFMILNALGFEVTFPTVYDFLCSYSRLIPGIDNK